MSTCPLFGSNSSDIGKLILRITLGGGMLMHGIAKVMNGISGIKGMLASNGLPEFLAYGVYVGEVLAAILVIIGFKTRISALVMSLTMFFAIFVAFGSSFLNIGKTGGFVSEAALFYALASIALMFLGAGKYSLDKN
ncbi:MAG: DoxX family protein [Campylobacteraceae bacterium]